MLLPNITISPLFGKCLFSVFDLIAGFLIYVYIRRDRKVPEITFLVFHFSPKDLSRFFNKFSLALAEFKKKSIFELEMKDDVEEIMIVRICQGHKY